MERQITLGDVIAPAKVLRCDNDDYPVLSMTMHDGIVLQSDRFKKSLASIDQSNYKVVLRGQLVVGFPIDEGVIYVQNITEAGIMSPAYGVWNIYSKEIMPEYLELCLHSPQSMDYYKNKLRGTTARRRSITTGDLLALPITLPSLTEQKRRISLLKQATLLLNSQKQAMLKFDELVKSRFVEMFGTVHNNVFQFAEGTLESISYEFFAGGDKPSDCTTERDEAHPYPVFANGYENEGLQGYSAKCRVTQPAVTVSARGTIGYCFIREAGFTPVVRLITIVPNNKVSPVFLKYAIDTMDIKSSGTSQAQLTVPDFKRERIIVPPADLQGQFAAFVSQVDKSKLAVQQSLEKLETLKKSLMQQYFG